MTSNPDDGSRRRLRGFGACVACALGLALLAAALLQPNSLAAPMAGPDTVLTDSTDSTDSTTKNLPRSTRLQGRTYIDRNNRVVGAGVMARSEDDPSRIYLTSSDALGQFRINGMIDGNYEVLVTRDGFQTERKQGVELKFPFRAVVELQMQPGDSGVGSSLLGSGGSDSSRVQIRGLVLDPDGNPIPEAQIRLVHPKGARDPFQVSTDLRGQFVVETLDADVWRLESRSIGFLPIRQKLPFSEDVDLQITLVRQPADYQSSPLELMPEERPIPPAALKGLESR